MPGDRAGAEATRINTVIREVGARLAAEGLVAVYPGAGHVFAGKHLDGVYREHAHRDSWNTAVDFVQRQADSRPSTTPGDNS